jgi:DNA-binding NarL/FixJ family response regulator
MHRYLSNLTVVDSRALSAQWLHKTVSAPTTLSRVLLVDDHPAVLRQVAQLLSGEFQVVDALLDGRNLQRAVGFRHPDVVVLDITLPGASGITLARELAQAWPTLKIVILTVHADSDYAREALAAGALGYVVKSRLASDLIPALHAALEGNRFVSVCPGLDDLE